MIRDVKIPHTWLVGNDRMTHEGFAVFKIVKLNKPMEIIGSINELAEEAVESAEKLGDGYAAFRVFKSTKLVRQPKEMIQRQDLPVYVGP